MQSLMSLARTELSIQARDDLFTLRSTLEQSGYFNITALYGTESPRQSAKVLDRLMAPEPIRSLIGFCEFGESCDLDLLGLSLSGVADLVDAGLLVRHERNIALNDLRLIVHYGCLLLCTSERSDAPAYYGEDTLALARHILTVRPGEQVLDLCGGVGTQGVLAAKLGAHAVSVELNSELRVFQEAVGAMNPVPGSLTFVEGDLYAVLDGSEEFDHIFANPPLIPVNPDQPIGPASDGGVDGLELTRRICDEAASHLRRGGRLVVQGLSFGDAQGPGLASILAPLERDGFDVTIVLLYAEELACSGPMMRALGGTRRRTGVSSKEIARSYTVYSSREQYSHLYSWQLFATCGRRAERRVFPLHRRNSRLWQV